jgi:hypothetical protein
MSRKPSYAGEFDDVLSSSPEDQSTPQLRPELSFENNTKNERNVHAGTRSLFDSQPGFSYGQPSSHMDIDVEQIGVAVSEDRLKRKESQEVLSPAKRTKKHPSPPRDHLQVWGIHVEQNLRKWEMDAKSFGNDEHDDEDETFTKSVAATPLSTKDANETVKTTNNRTHGTAFLNEEAGKARSTSTIGAKKLKSAMRKPATKTSCDRESGSHIHQNNVADGSMDMDQDELQWTKKEYDIQVRKFGSDEDKAKK